MAELAPYDPSKIMDSVRDRIRSEFVSLIPPEHWSALVKKAVDGFFQGNPHHYNDTRSDFERLVQKTIEEDCKRRILAYLSTPEWTEKWDGSKNVIGAAVTAAIKDNAPEFAAAMLGRTVQMLVQETVSKLRG